MSIIFISLEKWSFIYMSKFSLRDIKNYHNIHFIGVGGISMSALAQILLSKGYNVSGSDLHASTLTQNLEKLGLRFILGHKKENVENVDLVVYTVAVSHTNPEILEANNRGIPTIQRSALLGAIMDDFKYSLAISGTHGKTTTTSMLSHILIEGDCDPTILVGAELDILQGNLYTGNGDYFLAEACEYHRSFLDFNPFAAIILNVEPDHLDYFKDADDYHNAYIDFVDLVKENGFIVANGDDEDVTKVVAKAKCRVSTFGTKDNCTLKAKNIKFENGLPSYDLYICNNKITRVELNVGGNHNILNSLAALAMAYELGLDVECAVISLKRFIGAKRRFEFKGMVNGARVYDDYAHHPTEIKATIDMALTMLHKKLICVFQPHTFSRTKLLFDDFSSAFSGVYKLIIADIYPAREIDDGTIHSRDLANKIALNNIDCKYIEGFSNIAKYIKEIAQADDMVIIMGAGDIVGLTKDIIE